MTEIPGYCTLCRSRCGTINTVEDGRLVSVRPNPDHPTGKAMCPKGRAAPEIAHSARRLKTPLRRTKPKGAEDAGFVAIGWDEALDEIAAKLARYKEESGPQSVAFAVTSGSSSSISDSADWIQRLVRGFGSPNLCFSTEVCNWHKDNAHAFTFGCATPVADYRHTDLILLWGHNPANVWLAQAEAIGAARANGAKMAVIDPRQTASARDADLWLRVHPGTDAALALGLARWLVVNDAYDQDFVRHWTNGALLVRESDGLFLRGRDVGLEADDFVVWDMLTSRPRSAGDANDQAAMQGRFEVPGAEGPVACRTAFDHYGDAIEPYDPAIVEAIAGVPAHQIEELGALIASARSVCYHGWTGIGQHTNASQTDRAIATLYALTGSFDRAGGNVRMPSPPTPSLHSMDMLPEGTRAMTLGLDTLPIGPPANGWVNSTDFYDAVLEARPYRVRALVGFGANMLVSHPAPERGKAALEALDFQVHCDLFMNPTAESADIVLPVASPWEFEALRIGFEISPEAQQHVQLRPAMIPPQGEARSDMWIAFELGRRLGMGDLFFGGNIDRGFAHQIAPLGLSLDDLREHPAGTNVKLEHRFEKYRTTGFATQTGKAELYSELLLRHGYSPVPHFVQPAEKRSTDFPLTLFSVNNGYFRHSQDRGTNGLRRRRREPVAEIHPTLAAEHGISDGDWMTIETRLGEIRTRAKLNDALAVDVVASDYGWWQAAPDLGLPSTTSMNFNALISERDRDPISGGLALRSFACRVQKHASAGWRGWRPFVVTERCEAAAGVVGLTFEPAVPFSLPPFAPGQYLGLRIGEMTRSYSFTGRGHAQPQNYSIAVRRQGMVSGTIWRELQPGSLVELRPPGGDFLIPTRQEFPIVLIAGGIGITPFLSYLETLDGSPHEPTVTLYYVCRSGKHRPFHARLRALERKLKNVTVITYLTMPEETDIFDRQGRFTVAHIDQNMIDARARFYMCAADGMMDEVIDGLKKRGVPPFEIFKERFGSPATVPLDGLTTRSIHFSRSGRTVEWQPGGAPESILSVAEKAGIALPSGCRVGQCESCAVILKSGEVHHLTDTSELEPGHCLTCQAMPLSDLVIEA
ncbi:molybdopterin-dependent oxidoreductase [Rhizobium laguerreae]|uniref:Molybdopterin-dependent oxidoreductase n=1 Tax=Rhizobium laguerreae TaxID=1076926 RepID=A0A6N9ZBN9_9HYPH|nr:molybdopterin-dependent oxidoreductase [Rhizobium laguerreae]NEH90469.1 molybdopterin-dependent oxidoreductase [Rhizobium laguerreae]